MITHVALFRWKPEITHEQIAAISAGLGTLPGVVPSIRTYRHGPNMGTVAGNYDYAVVATFDDLDGWRAYDEDPAHDAVRAEVIRPWIAERASIQYDID